MLLNTSCWQYIYIQNPLPRLYVGEIKLTLCMGTVSMEVFHHSGRSGVCKVDAETMDTVGSLA